MLIIMCVYIGVCVCVRVCVYSAHAAPPASGTVCMCVLACVCVHVCVRILPNVCERVRMCWHACACFV